MFKYIAGNSLKNAINVSQKIIKNNKKPILNFAIESSISKNLIENEYKNIANLINNNYKIAIKLSLFDFNEKLINKTINSFLAKNIQILIDAENDEYYSKYDNLCNDLILKHNKNDCNLIKTYQMYRKGSLNNLENDIKLMNKNNCKLGVKLVRGAYWNTDKLSNNLFINKIDTDLNYNEGILMLSKDNSKYYNLLATHNTDSLNLGYILNKNKEIFEFAHLMGMKETKFEYLVDNNQKVNVYIPYGPYKFMIPYLFRRLYENIDTIKYMI